jgi:hypothetical protein
MSNSVGNVKLDAYGFLIRSYEGERDVKRLLRGTRRRCEDNSEMCPKYGVMRLA